MIAAPTAQSAPRIKFMRPLLDVISWRLFTGKDEDEMIAAIECGDLRFAFDIAGPKAKRMTVRVWIQSLICFLHPSEPQPAANDLPAALNQILPHRRDTLRCSELYRALNCSPQLVIDLVDKGMIERVPGDIAPKESPSVTRKSVVRFFTERRLPK